jgi:hypothetical protein
MAKNPPERRLEPLVARSDHGLGARRAPGGVAPATPWCLGRFSRVVRHAPRPGIDPDGYLAAVIELVDRREIDALIPVHEQAHLFAAARQRLPAALGVALAEFDAFEQVQSKAAFSRLLTRRDVPQPATEIVPSADAISGRPYPFFVKAAFGTASNGVWRIGDARHRGQPSALAATRGRYRRRACHSSRSVRTARTNAGGPWPGRCQPHLPASRRRTGRRRRPQTKRQSAGGPLARGTDRSRSRLARRPVVRLHPPSAHGNCALLRCQSSPRRADERLAERRRSRWRPAADIARQGSADPIRRPRGHSDAAGLDGAA